MHTRSTSMNSTTAVIPTGMNLEWIYPRSLRVSDEPGSVGEEGWFWSAAPEHSDSPFNGNLLAASFSYLNTPLSITWRRSLCCVLHGRARRRRAPPRGRAAGVQVLDGIGATTGRFSLYFLTFMLASFKASLRNLQSEVQTETNTSHGTVIH
eukprot:COSAG02_NODE_82_length_39723_cov_247.146650_35_plen_152_part_00